MSEASKNWFDVDRKGLGKLVERRDKIALILELVSNALDADGVTRVEVVLEPEEGVPHATVLVTDELCSRSTARSWARYARSS